jgi:TP901 family phage tail tape measure protein
MADVTKTIDIIFGFVEKNGNVLTDIGGEINKLTLGLDRVTSPIANVTTGILKTEAALGGLAAAMAAFSVNEAVKFESSQISLAKVLDGDPDSITAVMEKLSTQALDLSVKYGQSAESILEGFATFKQAGFDALESAKLQEESMKLVIAGNVDARTSTELLVASLIGFNAKTDEASRFTEALNNVSNNYATNLELLALGMSKISPIASKMGFTFEETTGLITPIIEVFRSGRESATALKTGLLKLVDDSKEVRDALASIGVSQFDLNGEMRSGKDIFYDVAEAFKGLTTNQQVLVTQQIVGIEQAGRMAVVFSNLDKVLEITNVAMEKTGSVTKEVELRLASAKIQIAGTFEAFRNLSIVLGEQLLPATGNTAEGIRSLLQSFSKIIDSGGLDPLIKELDAQSLELKDLFVGIAAALPEAFKKVDFSGLISSFENLKGSVGNLFGNLDLTNVDDLSIVLQRVVDFLALLTNASAGAVQGLQPLIQGVVSLLEKLSQSKGDTQVFIGEIGGIITSIDKLIPVLQLVGNGLTLLGEVLLVFGSAKVLSSIGNLQLLSRLVFAAPAAIPIVTAVLAITAAVQAGTEIYKAYTAEQELNVKMSDQEAKINAIRAGAIEKLNNDTKLGIATYDQFLKVTSDGTVVFDKATDSFRLATDGIKKFDDQTKASVDQGVVLAGSLDQASKAAQKLSDTVSGTVDNTKTAAQAQADLNKAIADAEAKHLSYQVVMKDGVPTLKTWGGAADGAKESTTQWVKVVEDGKTVYKQMAGTLSDAANATSEVAKKTDELTERQKILLEQTHETELTLLELASNEKIKAMEFSASIRVADIQAQAQQVVAAFSSIGEAIDATQSASASIFGDLVDAYSTLGRFDLLEIERYAENQQKQAQQALDNQSKLIDAQVRNMDAKTESILAGNGLITINADNLQPALQLVLNSLVEEIQIQANLEGLEFLL